MLQSCCHAYLNLCDLLEERVVLCDILYQNRPFCCRSCGLVRSVSGRNWQRLSGKQGMAGSEEIFLRAACTYCKEVISVTHSFWQAISPDYGIRIYSILISWCRSWLSTGALAKLFIKLEFASVYTCQPIFCCMSVTTNGHTLHQSFPGMWWWLYTQLHD